MGSDPHVVIVECKSIFGSCVCILDLGSALPSGCDPKTPLASCIDSEDEVKDLFPSVPTT